MRRHDLLAGLALAVVPRAARAQTTTHLKLGTSYTGESFMEGTYARDGGFLKSAGFDVETVEFGNGGNSTTALIAGAADLAISNVGSLSAAFIRGIPICTIAPSAVFVDNGHPTTELIVLKDAPIHGPRDLVGKTIALSTLRDLQQAATMAWLEKGGVDPKSVNFVEVNNAEQPVALGTHRVDAAVAVEPFITTSRDVTRILASPYAALGPRVQTTVWLARRDWVAQNPAATKRFQAAIHQTAQWIDANPAATGKLLSTYTKLAPDVIAIMARATYGQTLDAATIQPVIDASAKYGFLPRAFKAEELFATGV